MARPTLALCHSQLTVVRSASSIIVADNASLVDANIDPAVALNCWGFDTIWVGCEITAGTNPSLTIEPLIRDADAADGSRWRRLSPVPGSTLSVTVPADLTMSELRVDGQAAVYLRISAVANPGSTTAWKILASPGVKRNVTGPFSPTS